MCNLKAHIITLVILNKRIRLFLKIIPFQRNIRQSIIDGKFDEIEDSVAKRYIILSFDNNKHDEKGRVQADFIVENMFHSNPDRRNFYQYYFTYALLSGAISIWLGWWCFSHVQLYFSHGTRNIENLPELPFLKEKLKWAEFD